MNDISEQFEHNGLKVMVKLKIDNAYDVHNTPNRYYLHSIRFRTLSATYIIESIDYTDFANDFINGNYSKGSKFAFHLNFPKRIMKGIHNMILRGLKVCATPDEASNSSSEN